MSGTGAFLYVEIQCIMGNGHMGTAPTCGPTHTIENITFPLLNWWTVIIYGCYKLHLTLGLVDSLVTGVLSASSVGSILGLTASLLKRLTGFFNS